MYRQEGTAGTVKNPYDPNSIRDFFSSKILTYVETYQSSTKTIYFGQIQRQLLLYFT
jgi:hypothetical protein